VNICIFGDSIVWGAYDPENGGWGNLTRNHFEMQDNDTGVYHLGIPGDTSSGLLKRVEAEMQTRNPDILVFAIGTNDSQFVFSQGSHLVPVDRFRDNLEKLTEAGRRYTEKIVFVGLMHVDERKTDPVPWFPDRAYRNEGVDLFDNLLMNFCVQSGLRFISIKSVLGNDDFFDGLHPNSVGHRKIFEKIVHELEAVLG
jgi:lysophospholipase L1-like esterase